MLKLFCLTNEKRHWIVNCTMIFHAARVNLCRNQQHRAHSALLPGAVVNLSCFSPPAEQSKWIPWRRKLTLLNETSFIIHKIARFFYHFLQIKKISVDWEKENWGFGYYIIIYSRIWSTGTIHNASQWRIVLWRIHTLNLIILQLKS